jgi:mono/diheme cytochrome c family protein
MKKTIWLLAPFPLAMVALAATSSTSIWDGVFSAEQVARGKKAYDISCADCHGENLEGDGKKSPALKGETFFKEWTRKSVHKLVDQTWRTMPPEEPKTLSKALCADVTAFVLAENGFPAGKKEITADAPELRQILIMPKKK